jgi:hypothetical protein
MKSLKVFKITLMLNFDEVILLKLLITFHVYPENYIKPKAIDRASENPKATFTKYSQTYLQHHQT